MICLVSAAKLDFDFSLGQNPAEVLGGLTEAFISFYGEEVYKKAGLIIIREEHFFNIIKNIYGPTFIGHHNDLLEDFIEEHCEV